MRIAIAPFPRGGSKVTAPRVWRGSSFTAPGVRFQRRFFERPPLLLLGLVLLPPSRLPPGPPLVAAVFPLRPGL